MIISPILIWRYFFAPPPCRIAAVLLLSLSANHLIHQTPPFATFVPTFPGSLSIGGGGGGIFCPAKKNHSSSLFPNNLLLFLLAALIHVLYLPSFMPSSEIKESSLIRAHRSERARGQLTPLAAQSGLNGDTRKNPTNYFWRTPLRFI